MNENLHHHLIIISLVINTAAYFSILPVRRNIDLHRQGFQILKSMNMRTVNGFV